MERQRDYQKKQKNIDNKEMHPVIYLDDDPNHSSVCELWGGWAVPVFAEGPDAIAKATEEIRNKHLEGAMK